VDVQIGTGTELAKDRSDKGPNWTSTSVLDSKRTEVDKDRSGCTPYEVTWPKSADLIGWPIS